jgi:enamine deaminase RidA (YjgF/YER057c/UK114 family)
MSIATRLTELGITLPVAPAPVGNYVGGVITGNLLFMSGCGPRLADGRSMTGKLGEDMTAEQGYDAARLVGLNMLANIQAQLGTLDRVERVVKVLGMVNCTADFSAHPKVINGFSDLFVEVFGESVGRGGRSAVGMMALPGQIPVEVEMILQVA